MSLRVKEVTDLLQFLRHIKNVIAFTQLPKQQRKLVFYSEGKNYWVHLEGLIKEVLKTSRIPVCYISSGADDPGLFFKHPNYLSFKIDEGFVRNWLFENIEADVMVMTMPDLHQYQVKRSKHNVHYVYVQHSLVSFHMVYREGAFDYYDTIFCAGPHHIKEIRLIEGAYNLPAKNLVEHGYGRLDAIIAESSNRSVHIPGEGIPKHVLFAPSWGPEGAIESGMGKKIIDQLMKQGYRITFRPHPQTNKFAGEKVKEVVDSHISNSLFSYENNVAGQDSLHESDIMISDWSGAALDYAFGLNKPVLFIDVPRKINNQHYENIKLQPIEVEIRTLVGNVLGRDDISRCDEYIEQLCASEMKTINTEYVFNIGKSGPVGAAALVEICGEE